MNAKELRFDPRFRWPRVSRIVEGYVGDRALALRYVRKAATGEKMYVAIVREAFARRHKRKPKMSAGTMIRLNMAKRLIRELADALLTRAANNSDDSLLNEQETAMLIRARNFVEPRTKTEKKSKQRRGQGQITI